MGNTTEALIRSPQIDMSPIPISLECLYKHSKGLKHSIDGLFNKIRDNEKKNLNKYYGTETYMKNIIKELIKIDINDLNCYMSIIYIISVTTKVLKVIYKQKFKKIIDSLIVKLNNMQDYIKILQPQEIQDVLNSNLIDLISQLTDIITSTTLGGNHKKTKRIHRNFKKNYSRRNLILFTNCRKCRK
jgi:hypothetical protein